MRIKIDHTVIEARRHISQQDLEQEFEIVQAAIKDPQKFQILYDRYFASIFNYVYRRIDDEDITADLTSQTFLKALGNLKRYKFKGVPFSAWLYRIASNEVNRHYRQTNRKKIFSIDEQEFEHLIEQNVEEEGEVDVEEVLRGLQLLNAADIEAVELRFFERKSFAEMAFILEITEASAKMRTYRAIDKLRNLLKRREG